MNKYIHYLVESLFDDDFDEIYQSDEALDDVLTNHFKITSFEECHNVNDINCYLTETFKLNTILINLIFDIITDLKNKKNNFKLSNLDSVIKKYKDKGEIIADKTGWYSDENEY